MTSIFLKATQRKRHEHREESHKKMEEEIRAMKPQAKKFL
jgi:hypothetical protein